MRVSHVLLLLSFVVMVLSVVCAQENPQPVAPAIIKAQGKDSETSESKMTPVPGRPGVFKFPIDPERLRQYELMIARQKASLKLNESLVDETAGEFTTKDACSGCCVSCAGCSSCQTCESCDASGCEASGCSGTDSGSGGSSGCFEFDQSWGCEDGGWGSEGSDQVHSFKSGPCIDIVNLATGETMCFEEDHLVKVGNKWVLAREIQSNQEFEVKGPRMSNRLSSCWFDGKFQGQVKGFTVATYPLIDPDILKASIPTWLIKAFNYFFNFY